MRRLLQYLEMTVWNSTDSAVAYAAACHAAACSNSSPLQLQQSKAQLQASAQELLGQYEALSVADEAKASREVLCRKFCRLQHMACLKVARAVTSPSSLAVLESVPATQTCLPPNCLLQVQGYLELLQQWCELQSQLRAVVTAPRHSLPFLQPGRLVRLLPQLSGPRSESVPDLGAWSDEDVKASALDFGDTIAG